MTFLLGWFVASVAVGLLIGALIHAGRGTDEES